MKDSDNMEVIVKNLNKKFGEKIIFNNFSASFSSDKITCIMGESGSGKTTLFNILSSLTIPDSYEILNVPKKIGYVFQENRLCENFSAITNIKIALSNKTVSDEEIEKNLNSVGIYDVSKKPVSKFSGGMKRRVAIVRAIMSDSDLILLDEPLNGLDEENQKKVIEYIINNTKNKVVIISTHDISNIDTFNANLLKL